MLLVEAQGAVERDAPIDLHEYASVIGQLRGKNYSFGKIAEWLAERLGRPINKGGVFRVYEDWVEAQDNDERYRGNFGPPPDEEDQVNQLIQEIADEILSAANGAVVRKCLPSWFAPEAITRAAKIVEREKADERAAEEADAPNNEKQAEAKP